MAVKYLVCENCKQVVARFEPEKASIPIKSGIFESHLADRGVLPPWLPGVDPAWMKCPVCPKRVFNVPDPASLFVSDSPAGHPAYHLTIEEPAVEGGYICPGCGKEYKTKDTFDQYHKCPAGVAP